MDLDRKACAAAWGSYLATLPPEHPHRARRPTAFAFGDEPALADELGALVMAGRKRATTSLAIQYTSLNLPLPTAFDLSIILAGNGQPCAIIERTQVTTLAFEDVDAPYAAIEGEGDCSLASWRAAHERYFAGVCARLGGHCDARTPVLCQVFQVVWVKPDAG